ncbi:MAG: PIN domain-containing protein [Deltaproteobacteria bacterium]|nr:PIN domain-containing protein [Deltaproteobacteria bacterium]
MPIKYSIAAKIVDIAQAVPRKEDRFLIDTNVWLWMTYSKAGHGAPVWRESIMRQYAAFIESASVAEVNLYWNGLSLAELAHLIEKTEREIYEKTAGPIKTKEYRHNLNAERSSVASEVQAAWGQVISLADPLSITIDAQVTEAALNRFQTEKVDGYDLFILESMKNHGVTQVITDDGDFASVPDLQVFTANRGVINAARDQGKLVTRGVLESS